MADMFDWVFEYLIPNPVNPGLYYAFTVPFGKKLQIASVSFSTTHTANRNYNLLYVKNGIQYPIERVVLLANAVPDRTDISALLIENCILLVYSLANQAGITDTFVFHGFMSNIKV